MNAWEPRVGDTCWLSGDSGIAAGLVRLTGTLEEDETGVVMFSVEYLSTHPTSGGAQVVTGAFVDELTPYQQVVVAEAIYAVHTDGGAPINESALCQAHFNGEWLAFARQAAESAEDRPGEIEFRLVEHPENNDTVCVECRPEPRET